MFAGTWLFLFVLMYPRIYPPPRLYIEALNTLHPHPSAYCLHQLPCRIGNLRLPQDAACYPRVDGGGIVLGREVLPGDEAFQRVWFVQAGGADKWWARGHRRGLSGGYQGALVVRRVCYYSLLPPHQDLECMCCVLFHVPANITVFCFSFINFFLLLFVVLFILVLSLFVFCLFLFFLSTC